MHLYTKQHRTNLKYKSHTNSKNKFTMLKIRHIINLVSSQLQIISQNTTVAQLYLLNSIMKQLRLSCLLPFFTLFKITTCNVQLISKVLFWMWKIICTKEKLYFVKSSIFLMKRSSKPLHTSRSLCFILPHHSFWSCRSFSSCI